MCAPYALNTRLAQLNWVVRILFGPGLLVAWGGHAGGVFGERRCGEGTDANPVTVAGGAPRIVGVANCQSEVIECGHGVAVFGLKSRQKFRRG